MKEFFIYVLKSGICISIFFVIYQLFLRRTTFFKFNRAFLLLGIGASFVLPLFKYTYVIPIQANDVMLNYPISTIASDEHIVANEPATNWWMVALVAYGLGMLIFLLRNIFIYINMLRLTKSGTLTRMGKCRLIDNSDVKSPFSIVNHILFNASKLSETEKKLILKHEITHVNQRHWVDLFCGEIALIAQWINPFMWLYIKIQKENHEFLADNAVIDSGVSPSVYQAVLINQRFDSQIFRFTNSFSSPNNLNRLTMMKKEKSSPWKRFAALAIIPAFGLFFWASAEANYVIETDNIAFPSSELSGEASTENKAPRQTGKKAVWVHKTLTHKRLSDIFEKNPDAIILLDGKKSSKNEIITKLKSLKTIVEYNPSAAVLKYGDEGKNGVVMGTTEKPLKTILYKPDKSSKKEYKVNTKKELVFIDGHEVKEHKTLKLNDNKIKHVYLTNVSQNKDALHQKYGDKIKGKSRVVEIITKDLHTVSSLSSETEGAITNASTKKK